MLPSAIVTDKARLTRQVVGQPAVATILQEALQSGACFPCTLDQDMSLSTPSLLMATARQHGQVSLLTSGGQNENGEQTCP